MTHVTESPYEPAFSVPETHPMHIDGNGAAESVFDAINRGRWQPWVQSLQVSAQQAHDALHTTGPVVWSSRRRCPGRREAAPARIADRFEENTDRRTQLPVTDNGTPIRMAYIADVHTNAAPSRLFSQIVREMRGDRLPGGTARVQRPPSRQPRPRRACFPLWG